MARPRGIQELGFGVIMAVSTAYTLAIGVTYVRDGEVIGAVIAIGLGLLYGAAAVLLIRVGASVRRRDRAAAGLDGDLVASRVDEELRRIIAEEIGPGQRLPSERTLAHRLGVNRTVVRLLLATLTREGVIEPADRGYTVAADPPGVML